MPNHKSSTGKTATITEASSNELLAHAQAAAGAPTESEELLELLMKTLALELLAAKKQGKPLSENLPLIDRLLKHEALRQRRAALRLRQLRAAAKSQATHPPAVSKSPTTATKSSPEELARINAYLRQSGNLPTGPAGGKNTEFQIDPKIVALPLTGEEPVGMKKAHI